jgi:hypothetical protein
MGRIGAAFFSAALALLAGIACYGVMGTLKVMLSPGIDAASPAAWLIAPLLILAEGLVWGLLGGGMYLLLPACLIFAGLAATQRSGEPGQRYGLLASLAVSAVLFAPFFFFGLHGRILDGMLLAVSIWVGVRIGLRQLERRLAPR